MRTCLTTFRLIFEFGAVQKCVHLGGLVKSFHASTSIYLQRLASIQPRTSPLQFAENEPPRRRCCEATQRAGDQAAQLCGPSTGRRGRGGGVTEGVRRRGGTLGCSPQKESGQTLFSVVSKQIFAIKYSFESYRRDLRKILSFALL